MKPFTKFNLMDETPSVATDSTGSNTELNQIKMTTEKWNKIEREFVKWDNAGHSNASQREILDWWKAKIEEYGKDLLTDYTEFLLKDGYCDSDVYSEGNSAIDRFMHPEIDK